MGEGITGRHRAIAIAVVALLAVLIIWHQRSAGHVHSHFMPSAAEAGHAHDDDHVHDGEHEHDREHEHDHEADSGHSEGLLGWLVSLAGTRSWMAVAGAFLWGVVTIILFPCHLASIPLMLGYIEHSGKPGPRRALAISALYALGILVVTAAIGSLAYWMGSYFGEGTVWGERLIAAIFLAMGLYLLGFLDLHFHSLPGFARGKGGSLRTALILGLVFGLALGPCAVAHMAPVLGLAFAAGAGHLLFAGALLGAYCLGNAAVIIAAGVGTGYVNGFINWTGRSRGLDWLKIALGLLALLAGFALLWHTG